MRCSQFVTLHWAVLETSGFFADLRSRVTDTLTIVLRCVDRLGALFVQLPCSVRAVALSVLACVLLNRMRDLGRLQSSPVR